MKAYRKISISSSLKKLSLTPMEAFEIFSRSLLHSAFSKEHHPKPKSLGLFALMEKIKDQNQLKEFLLPIIFLILKFLSIRVLFIKLRTISKYYEKKIISPFLLPAKFTRN